MHTYLWLCYLWATDAESLLLLWTVLTPHPIHAAVNGHYTRHSSYIKLLRVHHNHKLSISYHKNGIVVTNPLADGLFFTCFKCSKNIFNETSWLSTASLSLCPDGICGWKHFAFMWIVFTFVELFSFKWGRHNCVRNMVFSFTCAVLWKLHG